MLYALIIVHMVQYCHLDRSVHPLPHNVVANLMSQCAMNTTPTPSPLPKPKTLLHHFSLFFTVGVCVCVCVVRCGMTFTGFVGEGKNNVAMK